MKPRAPKKPLVDPLAVFSMGSLDVVAFPKGIHPLVRYHIPSQGSQVHNSPFLLLLAAIAAVSTARSQGSRQDSVLGYHGNSDRRGNFVVPGLTWEKAKSLRADQNFHAGVAGNVYAQPLFWRGGGPNSGVLLVATEDNNVQALDAATDEQIWMRSLGRPVARSALQCGNINPLGITGTPVIDAASETLYLDAVVEDSSSLRHRIFGLSLTNKSLISITFLLLWYCD
jgi:hypothetical protein